MGAVATAVGVAIAETVAAVSVEAGAALMVGGELTAMGSTVGAMGLGAMAGGAMGGLQAGITGGNVGMGILGGAVGGAATGGIGAGFSGELGAVGAGALGGAVGGAANAGITGSNPLMGAAMGGVMGGVGGALSGTGAAPGEAPVATGAGATGTSAASLGGGQVNPAGVSALTGAEPLNPEAAMSWGGAGTNVDASIGGANNSWMTTGAPSSGMPTPAGQFGGAPTAGADVSGGSSSLTPDMGSGPGMGPMSARPGSISAEPLAAPGGSNIAGPNVGDAPISTGNSLTPEDPYSGKLGGADQVAPETAPKGAVAMSPLPDATPTVGGANPAADAGLIQPGVSQSITSFDQQTQNMFPAQPADPGYTAPSNMQTIYSPNQGVASGQELGSAARPASSSYVNGQAAGGSAQVTPGGNMNGTYIPGGTQAAPAPATPPDPGINGDISSWLKDNTGFNVSPGNLGTLEKALPAAGMLGYEYLTQSNDLNTPQAQALTQQAQQQMQQAQQLQSYLTSGQLPAGQQQALTSATDAAKAHIRSQYASMGLSGSTMEQQALNQVDQNAQMQAYKMAQSLFSTGSQEAGVASGIYTNLMRAQMQQDQSYANSIGAFAKALGAAA